ncbi:MAG: hypothetical protein KIT14_10250 [bacterium]|nr:hypothetical protein [bacterium]
MRTSRLARSVFGLLVLATASPALAADLCVYKGASTPILIARPWKVPAIGRCRPITGTGGSGGMAYGTVCRSSDGKILRFGYTVSRQGGAFFDPPRRDHFGFGLPYPELSSAFGGEVVTLLFGESTVSSGVTGALHAEKCTGPAIN